MDSKEKIKNIKYFNSLASYYTDYQLTKRNYFKSVDNIVINSIRHFNYNNLLDIGSGNGIRSIKIAQNSGIKNLHLVDNNTQMMKSIETSQFSSNLKIISHLVSVLDLNIEEKFDVILCLWNVLGHISTSDERISALKIMSDRLQANGSIFLDVNNRYNIKSYHLYAVIHFLRDIFDPKDSNGDVSYKLNIKGKIIKGFGHLFNPKEIEYLIDKSGLKIRRRIIIDYDTGKQQKIVVMGQLLYELTK